MFKSYNDKDLLQLKIACADAYYNSSDPLLSDEVYDLLDEELKNRGISTNQVGSKLRDDIVSVKLPFYLGSMDKFKPNDDPSKFKRWLTSNKADIYIFETKLDGVSCLLEHKDGSTRLYTRGDGYNGSDITHLLSYIKIPKLNSDIAIRGELIMDKNKFEKNYSSESCNARNMVSGIVNARSLKVGTKEVEFIAYEILDPPNITPMKQLLNLNSLGFEVVEFSATPKADISLDFIQSEYNKFLSESRFEMDGLIIYPNLRYTLCVKNNPKYAIAFKPEQLIFEAKVVNVEWNVSRHGLLKPRVEIEPVKLSGVTITYATGHNAKFIVDKGIGKDSVILVTRSGDVIPKILDVVKSTKVQLPKDAVWNDNGVELCVTSENDTQNIKSIASFFEKIEAKFVSEQTIRKLYENKATTILKIVELKPEDMVKIKGIETKLATRTYTNIHTALQSCSLAKILGASGIFGFGLGVRKVEALISSFPDILTSKLSETEIRNKINDIDGFSSITTDKIISKLSEARLFIETLKPYLSLNLEEKKDKVVSTELKDKTFLFSGFRDKKLEAEIEAKGGKLVSSVSGKLKYLVVKDKSDTTSKIQKAKELGVAIISKDELNEMLA